MLAPSNILGHKEPRTEIRPDYFGRPYEYKTIIKKMPDRAELWERFKAMQREQPVIDHTGHHQPVPASYQTREILKLEKEREMV